ncbi:MAG: flavin reductase [Acidiferrobacteraceae bacterium]|nr:flavin reductase [Acidiferrobacteraceae bacterium]|tara:strand:+ start:1960 stop:2508 length:549 start_codon:yes stop_codon:yes gene_type:complete
MSSNQVSGDDFREALSQIAATVSVVTTDGVAGKRGLTVSSMCSVSADPPSVLVCVNRDSDVCHTIRENKTICVNVLKSDQAYVSDAFGGRLAESGNDPFLCTSWNNGVTGAPQMVNALVNLDCYVRNELQHGTHFIFVGEIASLQVNGPGMPLIYRARSYELIGRSSSLPLEELEYSWERYT